MSIMESPPAATVARAPFVGAEWIGAPRGFAAFCTSRSFDDGVKMPWREAAPKIAELLRRRGAAPPRPLAFAAQVHGTTIAEVTPAMDAFLSLPECDGLLARGVGANLVIRTADCLPVVVVDQVTGLFGACHAGWRGSRANILGALIAGLSARGADPARLTGWIGPAICSEAYEVSEELARDFDSAWGHLGPFTDGRLLDLWELNRLQSVAAGMRPGALADSGLCTVRHSHLFHSHRRQGSVRGHQFTVCGWLNAPREE